MVLRHVGNGLYEGIHLQLFGSFYWRSHKLVRDGSMNINLATIAAAGWLSVKPTYRLYVNERLVLLWVWMHIFDVITQGTACP